MDISQMIVQFANSCAAAIWLFLWALGGLVGLIWVGTSLLKITRATRLPGQPTVTIGDILPVMLLGGVMANLSNFINSVSNSFSMGTVSYGAISYSGASDFGVFAQAINAVLTLASVAGGAFFFRGVLVLKKAAMDGQSSQGVDDHVWKALTHMVGGAMLVQIPDALDAFRQTFGLIW